MPPSASPRFAQPLPAALAAQALCLALWIPPAAAQGTAPGTTPSATDRLAQVHELWTKATTALTQGAAAAKEHCGQRDAQTQQLAQAIAGKLGAAEIERLGRAAVQAGQDCADAEGVERRLKALRNSIGDLMGRMTADFSRCLQSLPGQPFCAALALAPELDALKAQHATLSQPATQSTPALLAAAAGAQAAVDKLKSKAKDAYGIGDEAAAMALELAQPKTPPGTAAPSESQVLAVTAGSAAFQASQSAERAKSLAQVASNDLVDLSLELARCAGADSHCRPGQQVQALERRASAAHARLQAALEQGEAARNEARNARWTVLTSPLPEPDRERAIRFLSLVEDNADAKALFGQDAGLVTASTAGAEASLRLSLSGKGVASVNRFNLSFTAPLDTSDNLTDLWQRRADGLSGRPSVRLTWNRFFMPTSAPWAYSVVGLTLTSARSKLNYVDPADLSKLQSMRTSPVGAGLQLVAAPLEKGQLHTLRVERQRSYEPAGDSTITCPATPAAGSGVLSCLSGSVGLPSRQWATVATYDWRQQGTKRFDLGLSVTHNAANDRTDVMVPIYLFNSGDKDADGKRNAGISLGWGNKGRGSVISVFIGAPFSLRVTSP